MRGLQRLLHNRPAWTKDPLWARARMVPSFDIDANWGPLPIDRVSGLDLTTHTRVAAATYVDSDGSIKTAGANVLRRQWDATNRRWGWLVEEARTNLLLNSQQLTAASWGSGTGVNATVASSGQIAPDGTLTASLIADVNGATASPFILQTVTLADSTTYTMSAFLKAGTKSTARVGIRAKSAAIYAANFDLAAGTTTVGSATSSSIQALGNGWYRCTATASSETGGTSARGLIYLDTASYTADGTGTIHAWGAQIEAGSFATSYVRTEASQATRDADVWNWLSIPSARSLYAEFTSPASGTRGVASLNDNSANQRIALNTSGTDPLLVVVDGGVTQASIDAGAITANTVNRLAARFGTNDFAASLNGGTAATDTIGTLPVVDRLFIGRSQAGEYLNGSISRLVGFAQPLLIPSEVSR